MNKAEAAHILDSELTEIELSAIKAIAVMRELDENVFSKDMKKQEVRQMVSFFFDNYSTLFEIVFDYMFNIKNIAQRLTNAPAPTDTND